MWHMNQDSQFTVSQVRRNSDKFILLAFDERLQTAFAPIGTLPYIQLNGNKYLRCLDNGAGGFFDWHFSHQSELAGVEFYPSDYVWRLVRPLCRLTYCDDHGSSIMIWISDQRQIDFSLSINQDFGGSNVYMDSSTRILMTFPLDAMSRGADNGAGPGRVQ